MSVTKPLLILGTRPEAIKMAPLIRECREHAEMAPIVCFTGQHREMLAQVASYFDVPPDIDLDLMRPNQTLAGLTARCLEGIDTVIRERQPTCVVAQGDTTTVLTASLGAFYHRLPFVHVEAGLRTGDMLSPWPEEFNRRAAGLVTAVHCAPTTRAAENLLRERVPQSQIHVTGNTVIDALLWTLARQRQEAPIACEEVRRPRMVLITGHRRENFGAGFAEICAAIGQLAAAYAEVDFVYPVHLNPNVSQPVRESLGSFSNVHLLAPATYPEFVSLMDRAYLILTDSGGVQEEAPTMKKPVLVMRDTTERPEAVEAGAVELVGARASSIVPAVRLLLENPDEYARRRVATNPYGDGQASRRIASLIAQQAWQAAAPARAA